jgi:hypothetical protein
LGSVAFANGDVKAIDADIPKTELNKLMDRRDGKSVNLDRYDVERK